MQGPSNVKRVSKVNQLSALLTLNRFLQLCSYHIFIALLSTVSNDLTHLYEGSTSDKYICILHMYICVDPAGKNSIVKA
jgi:hypothetical protein